MGAPYIYIYDISRLRVKEVGTRDSPGTSTFVRLHGITSQNTNRHDQ